LVTRYAGIELSIALIDPGMFNGVVGHGLHGTREVLTSPQYSALARVT
jgi:hypothetical protein